LKKQSQTYKPDNLKTRNKKNGKVKLTQTTAEREEPELRIGFLTSTKNRDGDSRLICFCSWVA